jgi:hypothetical protein
MSTEDEDEETGQDVSTFLKQSIHNRVLHILRNADEFSKTDCGCFLAQHTIEVLGSFGFQLGVVSLDEWEMFEQAGMQKFGSISQFSIVKQ